MVRAGRNSRKSLAQVIFEKSQRFMSRFDSKRSSKTNSIADLANISSAPTFQRNRSRRFGKLVGLNSRTRTLIKWAREESTRHRPLHKTSIYKSYKQLQKIIYLLLEEPFTSRFSKLIFWTIITSIISSTISEVVTESNTTLYYPTVLVWINLVTSIIFCLELILRIVSASAFEDGISSYIFQPLFLVDLAAAVPIFIDITGRLKFTIRSLANFRIAGIFRICRLLKTIRYIKNANAFVEGVKRSLIHFGFLLLFIIICNLFFSTLIFYAECSNKDSEITSIPVAMWWAVVTMTTVGYGDVVPATAQGKAIASIAAIIGNLIVSLPIVILGYNFEEVYTTSQEKKKVERLKETVLGENSKAMTADQKEIFFMKQRISKIEETNRKITEALRSSETLYNTVSGDLNDLFRTVYYGFEEEAPPEKSNNFSDRISTMERMTKARKKIKLFQILRRPLSDSEENKEQAEKKEAQKKITLSIIKKLLKEQKLKANGDIYDLDEFGDDEEEPNKIKHIKYRKQKKSRDIYTIDDIEGMSSGSDHEGRKFPTLNIKRSVLWRQKLKESRSRLAKPRTAKMKKPLKPIYESREGTPKFSQKQPSVKIESLFCIKSHSEGNANGLLSYRNQKLDFLDNKMLNKLLEEWQDVEGDVKPNNRRSTFRCTSQQTINTKPLIDIRSSPRSSRFFRESPDMTARKLIHSESEDLTSRSLIMGKSALN